MADTLKGLLTFLLAPLVVTLAMLPFSAGDLGAWWATTMGVFTVWCIVPGSLFAVAFVVTAVFKVGGFIVRPRKRGTDE